ncbi:hypothetical protein CesoFtcFv8_018277 [Champsocephalus esox]|uniref:Pentraxin (PTX) domain-containing protein n=1 Tax=Champsocephalus esox TaxID=159716 RepID=A0AAN8BFX0_9TELE|nr:hypothetical protein CesoFtcFv8_018277 [Champsocephalus esox]
MALLDYSSPSVECYTANKIKLPVVLFLVASSAGLARSVFLKTLVFPDESDNSYVEMVPQKSLDLGAFTLCMRVATELPNMKREIILFAYRTQDFDELNVWQELDGRYSFYLSGDAVMFKAPKLGPTETHMCVSPGIPVQERLPSSSMGGKA